MSWLNANPFFVRVASPISPRQLAAITPDTHVAQFESPLTSKDHQKLAKRLRQCPRTTLRVFGHWREGMQDLAFLEHYAGLKRLWVEVFGLASAQGVEAVSDSLEYLQLMQTRSRRFSLDFLRTLACLREVYLEGHHKGIEALSSLVLLERLTLRSITLNGLSLLLPLKRLWYLDVKLGGTKDLSLLPAIGRLKYLELWRIKGLRDVKPIAELESLQYLYLESLKNVTLLPSFEKLKALRRVTLNKMQGVKDLTAAAASPALEELEVFDNPNLTPESFRPFLGHPTLRRATVLLKRTTSSNRVKEVLNLPAVGKTKADFCFT